jgi:hypothetical protein
VLRESLSAGKGFRISQGKSFCWKRADIMFPSEARPVPDAIRLSARAPR